MFCHRIRYNSVCIMQLMSFQIISFSARISYNNLMLTLVQSISDNSEHACYNTVILVQHRNLLIVSAVVVVVEI